MPDIFDQAVATPEKDIFDQAAEGSDIFDQAAQDVGPQPLSELSSRVLTSAAEGGIGAATMGVRLFSKTPLGKLADFVAEKTGGVTSAETITEMEGAGARAKDEYGVNPKYNQTFASALTQGVGQLAPVLASGPLAPITAGLMAGEQGYQEAEQAGATGAKLAAATGINAATALVTEKLLGLPKILGLIKASKAVPKSIIKTALKSAGFEGTQEVIEQVIQDLAAKGLYDPKRNVFDLKKLATVGAVGALVGGPVGGVLQLAENVSPEQIAPKEEMQDTAATVDQALAQAFSETQAPSGFLTPEQIQAVPEGTPEQLQQLTEQANAIQEPTTGEILRNVQEQPGQRESQMPAEEGTQGVPRGGEAQKEGFVGTAVNTPEGVVTGEEAGTAHPNLIGEALDKGAPPETLESNLGFAFRKPDGTIEWVDRVEAGKRLTESGQLAGLKTGEALTSEHIRNEVEGVTFYPEGITAGQAVDILKPFRQQAVEAARKAGASDPELAVDEVLGGPEGDFTKSLPSRIERREASLSNPGALLSEAARFQASKQAKLPTISEEVSPESTTQRGPRAESISKESVSSIQETIAQMPENDRKVMEGLMERKTEAEIVEDSGLTLDQVKKAKARGRKALAEFAKAQGIGERTGPGAASLKELRNARYLVAADFLQESTSKEEWVQKMKAEFEDTFTKKELDEAYAVAQEAIEQYQDSEGRKPLPKIIEQLSGTAAGEGVTGIKNAQTDIERQARGLPPAMKVARRKHIAVWDEAMRQLDADKQLGFNTVQKFLNDPTLTPSDTEVAILEHQQIALENEYDNAIDRVNEAKTDEEKASAWAQVQELGPRLTQLYDVERSTGTAAGRSLAARRMMAGRDYTLQRMVAETQAAKGEPLTQEETQKVVQQYEDIKRTNAELEERITALEQEAARKAYEQSVDEMGTPDDPVVKSLLDRITERLNTAADAARKRRRERLLGVSQLSDPLLVAELYDLSIIGASKIANGIKKLSKWKAAMRLEDLTEDEEAALDQIWQESNRMVDQAADKVVPEKQREKIKNILKSTKPQDVVEAVSKRIKARLEDGEPITDLRAYVQKMALAFTRGGITDRDALLEAVHNELKILLPDIKERQTMDLISGYGDTKSLDKEQAKVVLRDNKGQMQQLAKLEDLSKKIPTLQRTGIERRTISDAERRLIKEVNELKKRVGFVSTDPEKQLKSALDSIKTRVSNEIKDLTHQIETGEVPVEGTPAPTNAQIESLKALRQRLQQTLKDLEGPKTVSDESRVKMAEKAIEAQISDYEARIRSGETGPKAKGKTISTPNLEALRAKRESLKAELDALRAADDNLTQTKRFDALMKTAEELEGKLARGEIQPETKAARIEDELVTQARQTVQDLRTQMKLARQASPEGQQARLDMAIQAVEKSIQNYDQKLKTGNVAPTAKGGPASPMLERLRAERDSMRKLVDELRRGPRLTSEEVALKSLKARLTKSNADMLDRIARSDFEPRKRKEIDVSKDPEAIRIKAENERIKSEYEKRKGEYAIAHETAIQTALRHIVKTKNTAREVKSSIDLSAIARQGGPLAAIMPITAAKNAKISLGTAFSQGKFERSEAEIRSRPNAPLYKSSGLYLADIDGPISRQEEAFRQGYLGNFAPIKGSNRAYVTFLNRMRVDAFDGIVNNLPFTPTPVQLKAIAHFINVFSGRGDLGSHKAAAETLSTVLWSPRLLMSRMQLLAMEPIFRKDAAGVRKVIAKQYAKLAGAGAVILGLAAMAGIKWEKDPRSANFGKFKFGNTYVDPWAGLQQVGVFATRLINATANAFSPGLTKGDYLNQKGELKYLGRDAQKGRGPFDSSASDVTWRFYLSKASPEISTFFEIANREDFMGNPKTPTKTLAGLAVPLSWQDFPDMVKEHGLEGATALQILNLLGVGVQHRDSKPRQ